jgi:hypothetical protein
MSHESDRRRRTILSSLVAFNTSVFIYQAYTGGRPERDARDECLAAAVEDLVLRGTPRLLIESCDQDRQDRQVVRATVAKTHSINAFKYDHQTANVEPLLWLPDVCAWAYGKGGDWRRRVLPLIASVQSTRR